MTDTTGMEEYPYPGNQGRGLGQKDMVDGREQIQMNAIPQQIKGVSPGEEVLNLMEQNTFFTNEMTGKNYP